MIRWLRRYLLTEVVIVWRGRTPVAWAYGWAEWTAIGWVSYIEKIYVRPRYRGKVRRELVELRRKWFERADRLGYTRVITKIDKRRLPLLNIGLRWGGYVPYGEDRRYLWCYLERPA